MIGEWVARVGDGETVHGRAHFVESEIEDRLVMRCGRQLDTRNENGSFVAASWSLDLRCAQCVRRTNAG